MRSKTRRLARRTSLELEQVTLAFTRSKLVIGSTLGSTRSLRIFMSTSWNVGVDETCNDAKDMIMA